MKFNLKRRKKGHNLVYISIIYLGFLSASCNDSSNVSINTESELITKINAVQKQVMVQGNISKEEELAMLSLCNIMSVDDGLGNFSPDDRMVLKDVDIAPIYNDCEELSKEQTMACFNTKVSAFIKREFNLSISENLNLSEPKQVDAFFIIDENGKLNGMKIRDSEVIIQSEIMRVLKKLPVMKPAIHNEKNVAVLCSIIVKYGNQIDIEAVYIPERPNN